jgi:hypothetical protein
MEQRSNLGVIRAGSGDDLRQQSHITGKADGLRTGMGVGRPKEQGATALRARHKSRVPNPSIRTASKRRYYPHSSFCDVRDTKAQWTCFRWEHSLGSLDFQ